MEYSPYAGVCIVNCVCFAISLLHRYIQKTRICYIFMTAQCRTWRWQGLACQVPLWRSYTVFMTFVSLSSAFILLMYGFLGPYKASESHHAISLAFPPSPQELANSQIYHHNSTYPQGSKHIQFFYTGDNIQHFPYSWHASRHQTRTRPIIELNRFKCSSNLTPS